VTRLETWEKAGVFFEDHETLFEIEIAGETKIETRLKPL